MIRKLIELRSTKLAIARVDDATRAVARAGCAQLIELLSPGGPDPKAHISKAHSGRWIAVGISTQSDIGVDIEVARPRARMPQIAEWLDMKNADDGVFFSHWTLRESIAKCVGGSVLKREAQESALLDAVQRPDELIHSGGLSALCGQLEGGIYYSLVLKNPAPHESIRCA